MYYSVHALSQILNSAHPKWVKRDGNYIMNEAISFDIETTSTYINGNEKFAFMYVWMFDIFDKTIIGRTWQEFVDTMNTISTYFKLANIKRRIIVYVHNLAYEFSFIRKWFKWYKVFSLKRRKPLYALTTSGIEFRCSYRLSGYKLEKVGEIVGIPKLPDFDYQKIRHYKTPLSSRELEYCTHDVKIVSKYIRQCIAQERGDISTVPLTKTGYVRRYVRNQTIKGNNRCFYKNMIRDLTLEPEEYLMAKRAFAGGFTHASVLHAEKPYDNVTSFDIGSSYPTVLIVEKYPMSKGEQLYDLTEEQFEYLTANETCIFTIELGNVEQIFPAESYISESRCTELEKPQSFNGRIISAKRLKIDITSIDYQIIKKVYKFDLLSYGHFFIYKSYYLPTTFVECILHFFNIKTTLKDVEGKETEYMNGKENLNSLFGMCVTDIVRELIKYSNSGGWVKPEKMTEEEYQDYLSTQLDKENNKKSRFLFYLWGVFCTAYARRNLWNAIFHLKTDYIYADTDSVKILNADKHCEFFTNYNINIQHKLEEALHYHNLPLSLIHPKNIKGETKYLGNWEFDGHYKRFKAIRAKSYAYQYDDGHYNLTVAGLNKQFAVPYLTSQKKDFFELFSYGMHIPAKYTGKLTHTYIDEEKSAIITDYLGNTCAVFEKSSTHLEPADFHLSMAKALADALEGKKNNEYT